MSISTKFLLTLAIFVAGFSVPITFVQAAEVAVYPLQILQPQANLTTHSRYYKAYPGLLYKVPVGVFGGAYPFTYSLTSAPSGMTIDSKGIISWPNPTTAGSPHSVTVSVTDAAGTTVTRSWTITVTTQGFIFVDGTNGTHAQGYGCSANCGTGTIDNPFKSMNDFYQASSAMVNAATDNSWRNSNFVNYFVYWRAGTYGLEGGFQPMTGGQQFAMIYRGNSKPHVWLAYPGETVVIDHATNPGTNGAFFDARDGTSTDFYVQGITFRNMRNHAWRIGGYDNHVFFENRFENLGPGHDGDNSSFLMWTRYAPLYSDNAFIKDNIFDRLDVGAFIKTYSMRYGIIEGNVFTNRGVTGNSLEGIALKNDTRYMDIRGNSFDGNFGDGAINGNWNASGDFEIRFNKVLNAPSQTFSSEAGGYTIQMNHDTAAGPAYVHRNTFEGTVLVKFGNSGDGPFRIYDNVIVNENSGNRVSLYSVADPSVVLAENNLVGGAASNIIDANGNLTASYASYVGSRGYQLGSSGASSAPNIPTGTSGTNTPPASPSVPSTVPTSPGSSGTITMPLYQGLRGAQVTQLQTILSRKGYLSASNVTGYFGPLTLAAVKQFQCANSIVCSGTVGSTGYGFVGVKTRAALNSSK